MVTRTDTVAFTAGQPTSRAVKQPSTALATASLPLTVAKAVLAAPAQLLSLKITNTTDQASLLQQQANVIQQQTALLNDTKALNAAKAAQ